MDQAVEVESGDRVGLVISNGSSSTPGSNARKLNTFEGVFVPVCLAMFSAILFLRLGFILGNAGLFETLLMMLIAYTILIFTILSISAISTNGAIEGGGIYFMSSRVLGPEFGGAIGLLFFVANVVSSALYLTGCVEGLMNNFGPKGTMATFLPGGGELPLAYASIINVFNLVVCIFGATVFAKTSLIIFSIVVSVALSAIMSLLFMPDHMIPINKDNHLHNITNMTEFTGLNWTTFTSNLYENYTTDYTTNTQTDFATIFGVFFTGVTGVLAGANISGDLKNPAKSIPLGTLSGIAFTFTMYSVLFILSAASCSRGLLQNNYLYMQYTNVWPPLVEIGISSATISAALTNLIGASRLLMAISDDRLFGWLLDPIQKANVKGNPIGSVLMTWFIIQLMLLIGSLNQIAQVSSILFLYTYFSINLSCMMCLLTSAPNFRPSFKYFNLATTTIGLIGSSTMTFVIDPMYSSLIVVIWMLLMIGIHLRSPPVRWGNITQALIFHQVRKYLLLLDHRKEHVKYWRPRILLMVGNPRSCLPLIEFANDLKKSGLFVIGHVEVGRLDDHEIDPVTHHYPVWLRWLDQFTVKAFLEMTLAPSVREGMPHVARIAGLGAMKLNTIMLGFYDDGTPVDFLQNDDRYKAFEDALGSNMDESIFQIRKNDRMSRNEYVGMISDSVYKLRKIVCLARHFPQFDMKRLGKKEAQLRYIDIWPVDFFNPEKSPDNCANLLMQFACVLHMVPKWKSSTTIRLLVCAKHTDQERLFIRWQKQLSELRIDADVNILVHDLTSDTNGTANSDPKWNHMDANYIKSINRMLVARSDQTAVSFLYLTSPPRVKEHQEAYLDCLEMLTDCMPPTLLVHGNDDVVADISSSASEEVEGKKELGQSCLAEARWILDCNWTNPQRRSSVGALDNLQLVSKLTQLSLLPHVRQLDRTDRHPTHAFVLNSSSAADQKPRATLFKKRTLILAGHKQTSDKRENWIGAEDSRSLVQESVLVKSNQYQSKLANHRLNHHFVPQPIFLDELPYQPTVELTNNGTIYTSLNKILDQLKSQLSGRNYMSRMDEGNPDTKLKYEISQKNQTSPSEPSNKWPRSSDQQSALDQANGLAIKTINVPIQPLKRGDQYQPVEETHPTEDTNKLQRVTSTPPVIRTSLKSTRSNDFATTSIPLFHSSRRIEPTTYLPKRQMGMTTRRSSSIQDEEEPLGDEEEPDSSSSLNFGPDAPSEPSSIVNSNDNSLFKITSHPSMQNARPSRIKQTRPRSSPIFLASSLGSGNYNSAYRENAHLTGANTGIASPLNQEHVTSGPYKRRYGQKAIQLSNGDSTSSLGTRENYSDSDGVDLVDEGDLRSGTQLAITNDATYLDEAKPIERWPTLNPKTIDLTRLQQPSSSSHAQQQNRAFAASRSRSQLSSTGPFATLYGTRDSVPSQTSYQQMMNYQPHQQQAQQSTIQSQRDLLNQPQTIQITTVPNNGLVNGLSNQLIRISALGANNNLLNNGFNNVWNNGYLDPFGRQVMMVNAERRQIDWSVWVWPMIAVVTLPMVLGALFVPVFLKTIVILIQILQSLGLLLPMANALGQQIAQASGVAANASSTSLSTTIAAGNNQLEHVAN